MSTPDSSTALRGHVDAVFDPVYEQLFTMLDMLLTHHHRGPETRDPARVAQLRALLNAATEHLERTDND